MAGVFKLFGPSAFGAAVPNILAGAGLVAVSFLYARRLTPRFTAEILSVFIATSGFFAMQANEVRIYGIEIFFTVLAMWSMLLAIQTNNARERTIQLMVAGLGVGGAWLCRESSFVLGPFLLVVGFFSLQRPVRTLIPFVLTAGGVLAVELASYWLLTGDAFYRVNESLNHGEGRGNTKPFEFAAENEDFGWFIIHPWVKLLSYPTVTPIVGLAGLAGLLAFWKRVSVPFLTAVVFIGGAIVAFLGNGYVLSLETVEYYPLVAYSAYVVLALVIAQLIARGGGWRRAALGFFALVIVTSFAGEAFRDDGEYREANDLARLILEDRQPIWTDVATRERVILLLELAGKSPEEAEALVPKWDRDNPASEGLLYVAAPIGPFYFLRTVPQNCSVIDERKVRDLGWSKALARRFFALFSLEERLHPSLQPPPPVLLCQLGAAAA
ncbi:ArnT family glycosyltransferase [Parvularcula lutaonensis]|uniref:ArnT family glycosyltransferase n=1 Tax=Parvularcula lutaonensis TaxID=491923 RepID=A0ABV7M965_9PROT|nr:glycosyltransferase family 39 protein [Parvularcula lutaonensis]